MPDKRGGPHDRRRAMHNAMVLVLTALLFAVPSARAGEGSVSIRMFPFSVSVVGEDGR